MFGGCFDDEFSEHSRKLLHDVKAGKFVLVLSATTLRELAQAPEQVRILLADIPPECTVTVGLSEEIERLRDAYIAAGVVGPASLLDAEHIAAASVHGADVIVSWNFKHIVHFEKIRGYHAVNIAQGYNPIAIHSPRELVDV